jgi:hypothetical protein
MIICAAFQLLNIRFNVTFAPFCIALVVREWNMSRDYKRYVTDRVEWQYSENNQSQCRFVQYKYHMDSFGIEPRHPEVKRPQLTV